MALISLFFFFNDTATTEIYTLSLHDALPIYVGYSNFSQPQSHLSFCVLLQYLVERRRVVTQILKQDRKSGSAGMPRPISYAVFCLKKETPHCVRPIIVSWTRLPSGSRSSPLTDA